MVSQELDSVDKGILYLLQKDARRTTTEDMAEKVGVSSSTVANRINNLEKLGVIIGYHPIVDYSATGLGHHLLVTATVPLRERGEMMDSIMEISGIVSIRELLTNNENLSLEVVGRTSEDIEDTLEALDALGVDIERLEMMKQERSNPYNHFGEEFTNGEETG